MTPLNKKKLYLTLAAIIFLLAVFTFLHLLIKFSAVINPGAILWVIGFVVAILMLLAGITLAYLAATAGKKKQNIRYN